jgi:ribosomal protein L31
MIQYDIVLEIIIEIWSKTHKVWSSMNCIRDDHWSMISDPQGMIQYDIVLEMIIEVWSKTHMVWSSMTLY